MAQLSSGIFLLAVLKKNKTIIFIILLEGLLAFLWFHIFAPFGGKNPALVYAPGRPSLFIEIKEFLSYGNNFVFPFIIFPLTVFTAWKLKNLRYLLIIVFWIGVKIIVYSLLINPHGRFLVDVMPVSLLFFGFVYKYLGNRKQAGVILLLFFTALITNIFALIPAYLWNSHQRQFRFYPGEFASELTGSYPPEYAMLSSYLGRIAKPGDLFWSNNYDLSIYLYSHIPIVTYTGVCDGTIKLPAGAKANTQQKKVRWFIFYPGLPQSLRAYSCFGQKWQDYLEQHYARKIFSTGTNAYPANDPDIVNRQFPPIKTSASVVIYEKK